MCSLRLFEKGTHHEAGSRCACPQIGSGSAARTRTTSISRVQISLGADRLCDFGVCLTLLGHSFPSHAIGSETGRLQGGRCKQLYACLCCPACRSFLTPIVSACISASVWPGRPHCEWKSRCNCTVVSMGPEVRERRRELILHKTTF